MDANVYQTKFDDFIRNSRNIMFTFEVTKCCGYSTFITIYKHQSLLELYSNIINHFGNVEIKELFFITPQNERINVPISNQSISDFVSSNVICNPIKLVPVYPLPIPVIYKLFVNDTHCNEHHCSTVHYSNGV
jgi:hypothetical protein